MGETGSERGVGSGTLTLIVAVSLAVGLAVAGAVVFDATDGSGTAAAQEASDGTISGESNLSDAETKIQGNDTDDNAGYTVTGAGDVDGDGAHDVLVSSPYADDHGEDAGAVYLFYGPVDPGDVNVSDADVTFHGAEGDLAGWSVGAGDLDGDNYSDVVVGAPYADDAGNDSGTAYVVAGSDDLGGTVNLSADADATYHGENASDEAGYSVATVPDGDGTDALLLGAPYANSSDVDAGAAYLVRDETDGEQSVEDAAAVTYEGATVRDQAGWSVADAGDFTDDGAHEVIVAAPFNHTGDQSYAGAAYVLSTDYDEGETVSVAEGRSLHGVGEDDRAGFSVSTAGDANDDGYDDVVVGAPYNDSGGDDSGAAYIVHGAGTLAGDQSLVDSDVVLTGEGAGDRAGWSVADAGSGDVDCNGYDDVLVGAPFNNSTAVDAGAAYLVTGGQATGERSLSEADAKLRGEVEGDRAGWSVAAANDSTGDGNSDVLVGATHDDSNSVNAGAAYLVAGDCPVNPTEADITTPTATDEPTPEPRDTKTPTETPEPTATPATPAPEGDLDCEDFDTWEAANEVFQDEPGDPHGLDSDSDGIPCEVFPDAPSEPTTPTPEPPRPTANVSGECLDGDTNRLRLTAENLSDRNVTVVFDSVNDSADFDGTLQPDANGTVNETFDVGDEFDATLTVHLGDDADGDLLADAFLRADGCDALEPEEPAVEPVNGSGECVDGEGALTVTNADANETVHVEVTNASGAIGNVTLGPGANYTWSGLADGNYTITTIADGEVVGSESVRFDCATPEPTLDAVEVITPCGPDDVSFLGITNPNQDDVEVVVTDEQGQEPINTTLLPAESTGIEALPDGNYTVTTVADGETIGTETVRIDCLPDEPALEGVDLVTECGPGNVSFLGVTNSNQDEVRVVVTDEQDREPINTTLSPDASTGIEDLPDGEYTVTTVADGEEVGSETLSIDCEPAATDDPTETDDDGADDGPPANGPDEEPPANDNDDGPPDDETGDGPPDDGVDDGPPENGPADGPPANDPDGGDDQGDAGPQGDGDEDGAGTDGSSDDGDDGDDGTDGTDVGESDGEEGDSEESDGEESDDTDGTSGDDEGGEEDGGAGDDDAAGDAESSDAGAEQASGESNSDGNETG